MSSMSTPINSSTALPTLPAIQTSSPITSLLYLNRSEGLSETESEILLKNDAAWALSCAFLILTMQTGFAMLECGNVSAKNAASIMIKNCVDVTFGGFSYWCFGYGLTFGRDFPNPFCGLGHWFFNAHSGSEAAHYFFHFSFASTATTIVSGAVAERMNFHAYMVFALYNTIVYCIPASWAWNTDYGWLDRIGFFDFAGTCIVHYSGGVSALVAAKMVGPRVGRFEKPEAYRMSSPVTALTGMFMLWWAWMSFNAGSSFGVNRDLWKVSALAAVNTLNGGIAGGLVGIAFSMIIGRGKIYVGETVNSILGGLVAVTGICAITEPAWCLLIGAVGGLLGCTGPYLMERLKIDDPVGAVAVHLIAAGWGTMAIGLFSNDITGKFPNKVGLFQGGGFNLLVIQLIGMLAVTAWSAITTAIGLLLLDVTIGIRTCLDDEILGADWIHHEIHAEQWANDLFDGVLDKLSRKDVDERTATHVLMGLKEQLLRMQRSRGNSPASEPSRPTAISNDATVPSSGTTQNSVRDPSLNRTVSPRSLASGQSRRQIFREIVEAAMMLPPGRTYRRMTNGPMMMPMFKEYVVRPNTPDLTTPSPSAPLSPPSEDESRTATPVPVAALPMYKASRISPLPKHHHE